MDLLQEYAELIKEEVKQPPPQYQLIYEHCTIDLKFDQISIKRDKEPVYEIGREEPVAYVNRTGTEIYFTTKEPVENPQGVRSIRIMDTVYLEVFLMEHETSLSYTKDGAYAVHCYTYRTQKYTMLRRN